MVLASRFRIGPARRRLLPGKGTPSIKRPSALASAVGMLTIRSGLLRWNETMANDEATTVAPPVNANASMQTVYLLKGINISSYHFRIEVSGVN